MKKSNICFPSESELRKVFSISEIFEVVGGVTVGEYVQLLSFSVAFEL